MSDEERREKPDEQECQPDGQPDVDSTQAFWQWFAVGMLLFCWIAEASMCGQRGF